MGQHSSNIQKALPCTNPRIWAINHKHRFRRFGCRWWQEYKREGKERKRYYKNTQKCSISHPCSEGPNDAIFTKFGTVVDLTYVMTCANFGWYRLKGGHFAAVQHLPFSHDFNGCHGLTTGKHWRAVVILFVSKYTLSTQDEVKKVSLFYIQASSRNKDKLAILRTKYINPVLRNQRVLTVTVRTIRSRKKPSEVDSIVLNKFLWILWSTTAFILHATQE